MRILANDGIDPLGKKILLDAGFEVDEVFIPQELLPEKLPFYDAITVRSATQVRQELIDLCPNLKLIGRGGVGMDNIDVEYALSKGLAVVNTPASSSLSVAELVFSHLGSGIRFLHDSNRKMPVEGEFNFGGLKKSYSKGVELRNKTLGVVGFGRIGQEVAKIGLGIGMNVIAYDISYVPETLELTLSGNTRISVPIKNGTLNEVFSESDFISFHVPYVDFPILGKEQFSLLKDGVGLVNTSRGGVVDEDELIKALDSGKVSFAGLDVFENEPKPKKELLKHPKISATPHIGASTLEAQERIGEELAKKIIENLS